MPPAAAATMVSLRELADLAIGTPEAGAVNFTALHTLLLAMLKNLHLQDTQVDVQPLLPERSLSFETPRPSRSSPQVVVPKERRRSTVARHPAQTLDSQVKNLGGQVQDLGRQVKNIDSQVQGILVHMQHITSLGGGMESDTQEWLEELRAGETVTPVTAPTIPVTHVTAPLTELIKDLAQERATPITKVAAGVTTPVTEMATPTIEAATPVTEMATPITKTTQMPTMAKPLQRSVTPVPGKATVMPEKARTALMKIWKDNPQAMELIQSIMEDVKTLKEAQEKPQHLPELSPTELLQRIEEIEKKVRDREEMLEPLSRKLTLMSPGEEVTMVTWQELEQAIADGWKAVQGKLSTLNVYESLDSTTGLAKRKRQMSFSSNDMSPDGASAQQSGLDQALDSAGGAGQGQTSSGTGRSGHPREGVPSRDRRGSRAWSNATGFPGREQHPRARDEAGPARPHHPPVAPFRMESGRQRPGEQLGSAPLRRDEREAYPGLIQQDLPSARDGQRRVYPEPHGRIDISPGQVHARPDEQRLGPLGLDQLESLHPSAYPYGVVPFRTSQLGIMPPGMDEQGLALPGMGQHDVPPWVPGRDQQGLELPSAEQPGMVPLSTSQHGERLPGRDQRAMERPAMDGSGVGPLGIDQHGFAMFGMDQQGLIPPLMDQHILGSPGLMQVAADQQGFVQPSLEIPGFIQPGIQQHDEAQPGARQPGLVQPGTDQRGLVQPQAYLPGWAQIGPYPPGLVQPRADLPGSDQLEADQHGLMQPRAYPPSLAQPGRDRTGLVQPGVDQQGSVLPGMDQRGLVQPGAGQPGLGQPSAVQRGSVQPGAGQPGLGQPSAVQRGSVQPGADQPGLGQPSAVQRGSVQPGAGQPGLGQPSAVQRGSVQPGAGQPGLVQPSAVQRGSVQPGAGQPGLVQPSAVQSGLVQPGMGQPGLAQTGLVQPGMDQHGLIQPGTDQHGLVQPGMDQPGLIQPGMDQRGLVQPGMDQQGLVQPGAGQPGLVQPGMGPQHLVQPGAIQPGSVQPDAFQPGSIQLAAVQPGLVQPTADQSGFIQSGMDQGGLVQPGAGQPGLVQPGMDQRHFIQPGAVQPGLVQPSIDQQGLVQPGSGQPGMDQQGLVQPGSGQPGMDQQGLVQPGSGQPVLVQPRMDQQDLVQPGSGQPGLVQPGTGQPGLVQSGTGQPDLAQTGTGHPDLVQYDASQPGLVQRGAGQPDLAQTGTGQPGLVQYDASQPGLVQPGTGQPDLVQPGTGQPDLAQTGTGHPDLVQYDASQPGLVQRGAGQPDLAQTGTGQPGLVQYDASQPGLGQPGTGQSDLVQPAEAQLGLMQPGLVQPGAGQPGLAQPGPGQHGLVAPGLYQQGLVQPGASQPGLVQPGMYQQGLVQPGAGQRGLVAPGIYQQGLVQPGAGQRGLVQPGAGQRGLVQPGAGQRSLVAPGMDQQGLVQPGAGQRGLVQPGAGQRSLVAPGMDQQGLVQPGAGQRGLVQPGAGQRSLVAPGMDQQGLVQPGAGQRGLVQPGAGQRGLVQPGAGQRALVAPGMDRQGLVQPGAGQRGLVLPGMDQQGLVQPSSGQPDLAQPGAGQPGTGQPGLVQPGAGQSDLVLPGEGQLRLMQPGAGKPGLAQPGMDQRGLLQTSAYPPGLGQPGAHPHGLIQLGAYPYGLVQPGAHPRGLVQPGIDQHGLRQPGADHRGLLPSSTGQPDFPFHEDFQSFILPHPYQHGVAPLGRDPHRWVSPPLAKQDLMSRGIDQVGMVPGETYQQGLMPADPDLRRPTPLSRGVEYAHPDQQHLVSSDPGQRGQIDTEQRDHVYSTQDSSGPWYPGPQGPGYPGVDQYVQPEIYGQIASGQGATISRSSDSLQYLGEAAAEKSDVQAERRDSLDRVAPIAVETFRLMGEVIGLYVELKENMKDLDEEKAGQTELEKVQFLLSRMVQKTIPPDLQEQLKSIKTLTKEVRQEKAKLDKLQRILEGEGYEEMGKEVKAGHLGLQLCILRDTVTDIEKELAELRESQEQGKVSVEHSVSEASLYLQDQLDKLRSIIENMLTSSSTLLSLSMAPQKTQTTLTPGQIDPKAACPACSLDLGHQVSMLVRRYEQLQNVVSNLAASRPSKKAKLQSQDEELLGHVQSAILQVQGDCEKLNITTSNLIEDHRQKQKDIDVLYQGLEKLEKEKANREYLEMEIDVKADKSALATKVSRIQFDATTEQLNHMMQELVAKMSGQEQDWQKMLDKLLAEMDSKLDRLELDPVKQSLEDRWRSLRQQLKERSPLYQADEAACMRRQLLAHFHCLSCDRPLETPVTGQIIPVTPVGPSLPGHRSTRPYTIFELEQVRQQSRSLKLGGAAFLPRADLAPMERSVGRLRTMHSKMLRDIEKVQIHFGGSVKASSQMIRELLQAGCLHSPCCKRAPDMADYTYSTVPRRCGGSHTLTYPYRRNRLQQLPQGPYLEEVQIAMKHNEVDILGLDGHIYKGRMDMRLPGIPSKDSNTKHKIKPSRPHPHRQPSLSDNSQLPSRPQSAQMTADNASALSHRRTDRPVSSEGRLSQVNLAREMAAAGLEMHVDLPPGEGLEEPTRGPRSTAH